MDLMGYNILAYQWINGRTTPSLSHPWSQAPGPLEPGCCWNIYMKAIENLSLFIFLLCFSNSTWQHVEIVWINSSARKTRIKPQETCVAKWFSTKASPFWPPYSTFSGCSTASRGHRPSSSAPSSFAGIISWVRHLACASVMGLIHCTHLQQNLMSCWGTRMSSHLSWF
jgi:hypothetical protein